MLRWIMIALIVLGFRPPLLQDDADEPEIPVQVGGALAYGDMIQSEIRGDIYELTYTFLGVAGDVVMIEMRSVDRTMDNKLVAPLLRLYDQGGAEIVDTSLAFPIDDARLTAELPRDDNYRILVTREDGEAGESEGAFTLVVHRVSGIETGESVTGTVANTGAAYYVVRADEPFIVRYERISGPFAPQVSANVIERGNAGGLRVIASSGGNALTLAVLGVFEPEQTYLILLEADRYAYYFEDVSAAYRLTVEPAGE